MNPIDQDTPYSIIRKYTEYEDSLIRELMNQSLSGLGLLEDKIGSGMDSFKPGVPAGSPVLGEYNHLRSNIPNYLNRTHFVLLYSLFDRAFFKLASEAEKHEDSRIRLGDLSGHGVEKYYKYFQSVLDMDLQPVDAAWQKIRHYEAIRNDILLNHSEYENGTGEKRKKLESAISFFHPQLAIEYNQLRIKDPQFNTDFNATYLGFFDFVIGELDKRFLARTRQT